MRHLAPPLIALSLIVAAIGITHAWDTHRKVQRLKRGDPHDGSKPNAYTDARYSAGVAMTDNQ